MVIKGIVMTNDWLSELVVLECDQRRGNDRDTITELMLTGETCQPSNIYFVI